MEYTIKLTKGKTAVLCEEAYEYAKQFRWHYIELTDTIGYACRTINTRDEVSGKWKSSHSYMHVELAKQFGIYKQGLTVDHINRVQLDCRISNLRAATVEEQNRNRAKFKNCQSIYKGIYRSRNKWVASIYLKGIKTYLGIFTTELEAAYAYEKAAKIHFGAFAVTPLLDAETNKE